MTILVLTLLVGLGLVVLVTSRLGLFTLPESLELADVISGVAGYKNDPKTAAHAVLHVAAFGLKQWKGGGGGPLLMAAASPNADDDVDALLGHLRVGLAHGDGTAAAASIDWRKVLELIPVILPYLLGLIK